MKIGIIGCGHMGSAIAKALIKSCATGALILKGLATCLRPSSCALRATEDKSGFGRQAARPDNKIATQIHVGNPINPRIRGAKWSRDNSAAVKAADIIFIAVIPRVIAEVLSEIKSHIKPNQILISIAAGTPLKKLKKYSGNHKKIVRVMPNLAAQVEDSMSVWKAEKGLNKKEKSLVKKILQSFGKEIEVADEKLIDVATAICGGGPAYTAAFLESMALIAEKIGFSKKQARLLAIETVDGSLDYIKETGIEFSILKEKVQTKGGTTEAGFKILKRKKWQKTLEMAFLAGYKKAQEISKRK